MLLSVGSQRILATEHHAPQNHACYPGIDGADVTLCPSRRRQCGDTLGRLSRAPQGPEGWAETRKPALGRRQPGPSLLLPPGLRSGRRRRTALPEQGQHTLCDDEKADPDRGPARHDGACCWALSFRSGLSFWSL